MARPTPRPSPKSRSTPKDARKPAPAPRRKRDYEGATEAETGDRTGPGSGYDTEPEQVEDKGGVGN